MRHCAIAVPWGRSSWEEGFWRLSSWGPNLGRLASLRSICGESVWRASSTVLEALRGDSQQCLSLVSEQFGIKIWKSSLAHRASIDLASTKYYRDHWHDTATSQIRDCPVAGILMLHSTRITLAMVGAKAAPDPSSTRTGDQDYGSLKRYRCRCRYRRM